MSGSADACGNFGPWNPGIESQVPKEILQLSTIFRPENVFTSVASALELHGLTGFSLSELVEFRPQRLALHELLIRVTADFEVPDGSRIGDLGINFREIARDLLARCVEPHMASLIAAYEQIRDRVEIAAQQALAEVVPATPSLRGAGAPQGLVARLLGRRRPTVPSVLRRGWGPLEIAHCDRLAAAAADPERASVYRALGRVMSALFATHGHAWGTPELIVSLTTVMAGNALGGETIGRLLGPLLRAAAARDGYRLLPAQQRPVVINTKGASASGKSTLRPLQKKLTAAIGVDWADFALISPDIWRKQLLDYESLGSAYRYAGAFTGEELQIVDQKLDRYMAAKNSRGEMSHLLIDRFRFDSFAADSDQEGSNLLTRFGHTVYLFFVITPPDLLVERAWNRGLEFGRFKAVDDTLAHSVEAYSGIPDVFFTWVRRTDKQIRFEFLDNTVPFGERPLTVAFGDHMTLNVLDVTSMLNIDRFARIDVNATAPRALFANRALLSPQHNCGFLRRCAAAFANVNFVEQSSGRIYLRVESGVPVWKDAAALAAALEHEDTRAGVDAVAGEEPLRRAAVAPSARFLSVDDSIPRSPTLGCWATRTYC